MTAIPIPYYNKDDPQILGNQTQHPFPPSAILGGNLSAKQLHFPASLTHAVWPLRLIMNGMQKCSVELPEKPFQEANCSGRSAIYPSNLLAAAMVADIPTSPLNQR